MNLTPPKETPKTLLNIGIEYTFTINPTKQYENHIVQTEGNVKHTNKKLIETTRDIKINNQFTKVVNMFNVNDIDVILYMEASEPVRGNRAPDKSVSRLHYHGKIFFKNIDSLRWFFLTGTTLLSKICSYEIDTIDDMKYWDGYCKKQSFLKWPKIKTLKYDK